MAIKDYNNFDYNMEQLEKPINLNIIKQGQVMNSENFNSSLQSIQNNLDVLYEKTRYLEDSIDYARTFLDQKIEAYSKRINTIISSIEDISAINKNMSYLDFVVPFQENVVDHKDRNKNYKVKPCMISGNDKVLTLSNNAQEEYEITSITRSCTQVSYDSNLEEFSSGNNNYRAIYIEDKPLQTGVLETFTCYLPYALETNYIKTKAINSRVENVVLVYPNGITETMEDNVTGINTESRMITHFNLNVRCTAYDTVTYELDEDLVNADNVWNDNQNESFGTFNLQKNEDIWTKLKNYEYALSVDSETKLEVEALVSRTSISSTGQTTKKTYKAAPENIMTVTKYIYVFGIDKIDVGLIDFNNDCYFMSETIETGKFNEGDYLQLQVNDNYGEFSSIEYFIVDGDIEIPILPVNEQYVYNEKIFPENDLRFAIDDDLYAKGVINIKKDGLIINTTLDDIRDSYDATYCVSYQPVSDCYNYTPINDSIRVKAIIRIFGDTVDTVPHIKSISIKKYGGTTLWTKLY